MALNTDESVYELRERPERFHFETAPTGRASYRPVRRVGAGEIHFRRKAPQRAFQKRPVPARIEERLKALKAGFDEAVPTRLKDHGKRPAALERLEQRRIGGRMMPAALAAAGSSVGGMIVAVMPRLWR